VRAAGRRGAGAPPAEVAPRNQVRPLNPLQPRKHPNIP